LGSLSKIKDIDTILSDSPNRPIDEPSGTFDQNLKGLLNVPPPNKDEK